MLQKLSCKSRLFARKLTTFERNHLIQMHLNHQDPFRPVVVFTFRCIWYACAYYCEEIMQPHRFTIESKCNFLYIFSSGFSWTLFPPRPWFFAWRSTAKLHTIQTFYVRDDLQCSLLILGEFKQLINFYSPWNHQETLVSWRFKWE